MHEHFLKTALTLAEIRRGFCAPNPAVGAVLVKDNQILAKGYHYAVGMPHAEVDAFSKLAVAETQGATLYVTLEPCCHWGRTPPCTELLIERNIKTVVYGFLDPNPQVAGQGITYLENAGIECIYLPLPEVQAFYQSYLHWHQTRRPFVTAKLAMSMDGKIAGAGGVRLAITGEDAQLFTHLQRKQQDAILTTAKTVRNDDPLLNVRLQDNVYKKVLYVLDSHLTTPLHAKIFNTTNKLIFFCKKGIAEEQKELYLQQGAICKEITYTESGLDLIEVLDFIGQEGTHNLWVEAGGKCFEAFAKQNLLNKAFIYVAPKWLGEEHVAAFSHTENIFASAKTLRWTSVGVDAVCEMFW